MLLASVVLGVVDWTLHAVGASSPGTTNTECAQKRELSFLERLLQGSVVGDIKIADPVFDFLRIGYKFGLVNRLVCIKRPGGDQPLSLSLIHVDIIGIAFQETWSSQNIVGMETVYGPADIYEGGCRLAYDLCRALFRGKHGQPVGCPVAPLEYLLLFDKDFVVNVAGKPDSGVRAADNKRYAAAAGGRHPEDISVSFFFVMACRMNRVTIGDIGFSQVLSPCFYDIPCDSKGMDIMGAMQ